MPDTPTPGASGGAAPVVTGDAPSAGAGTAISQREVSEFVHSLIRRYGSTANALEKIAGDQMKYRKRAQTAEATTKEALKKVPAADAVVLSGEEAKAYAELKKSGHTLDKVPAMLSELSTLKTKDSSMSRESALKLASGEGETARYKSKVLGRLLKDENGKDIPIEFKKVNVKGTDADGKATLTEESMAYVVLGEGTAQTRELLDTYVEREHVDFLDVLRADGASTEGKEKPAPSGAGGGVSALPRQRPAPSGKPDDPKDMNKAVDRQLNSKYLSPSARAKQGAPGSSA
jgi:hypothetical protein